MKQKVKLAFEMLEKEMEQLSFEKQKDYIGGTNSSGDFSSGWYSYLTSIFGEPTKMEDGSFFWGKKPGEQGYDPNYLYNDSSYEGTWAGREVEVSGSRKKDLSRNFGGPLSNALTAYTDQMDPLQTAVVVVPATQTVQVVQATMTKAVREFPTPIMTYIPHTDCLQDGTFLWMYSYRHRQHIRIGIIMNKIV